MEELEFPNPDFDLFRIQEFLKKDSDSRYEVMEGDCLEKMSKIPDGSVDLICTDLPYGTTQNKWDIIIPFDKLWEQYKRVLKKRGVVILTAAEPFSSLLVASNIKMFKYDIIWKKTIGSGQLNIKRMPLRLHEQVLVFYSKPGTYNEQTTVGTPYSIKRKINYKGEGYGKQTDSEKDNDGFRHAKSVVEVSNPRIKNGHPTQKPIALLEYIIKTYSNEGDVVLDSCMGSGSTGVAALNLGRKFIGIEKDSEWFQKATEWLCKVENEEEKCT